MQEKLLILRKKQGISQQELADYLKISVTSYGQKERGEKAFTLDEMFALSTFFELSISEIFLPRKSPEKRHN